jgi:hypothetical protein
MTEQEMNAPEVTEEISVKRRMPPNLTRYLLNLQGKKYLPAAYRLVWFRDECPDWGIVTELFEGGQEAGFATVKASIFNPEGRVIATGHKTETKQDFPAGWVEKAEAGAVARALAYVGFGTQFGEDVDAPAQPQRPAYRPQAQNAAPGRTEAYSPYPEPSPAQEEEEPITYHSKFFRLWYTLDMPTDPAYAVWVAWRILVAMKKWPETLPIEDASKVDEEAWKDARNGLKAYQAMLEKKHIEPGKEPEYLNRTEVKA